jgi:uncharacterized C2H2 Zn-finger protein
MFATRICQMCANDIQTFDSFRKDLVQKQLSLYKLANIAVEETSLDTSINVDSESMFECLEGQDEVEEIEFETYENYEGLEEIGIIEEDTNIENDEMFEESVCNDISLKDDDSEMLKIEKVDDDDDGSKVVEGNIDWINDTKIECQICEVEISSHHIEEHNALMHQVDIECPECANIFQSKISLNRHMKEAHERLSNKKQKAKRKIHYCGLCNKVYDYKKHLDDHIRSFHNRERNAECNICMKKFYHRDLKKHILNVHGEKNINCKICGKMYTCMENLKLHLRYHEEPKYVCSYENCDRRFHQKILFENHLLKHGENKAITCQQCETSFYTPRGIILSFLILKSDVPSIFLFCFFFFFFF